MFESVKEGLAEVITLSDECPEVYREKCFEILLSALVSGGNMTGSGPAVEIHEGTVAAQNNKPGPLPMLFKQAGISEEEIQNVFHYDGGLHEIIVSDLKAKSTSQKQIRLAMLVGVQQLMDHGEALVPRDNLVNLCKQHSAHDPSNFATYMRSNKSLLLQKGNGWTLTVPGQRRAAEVIKELAT